MPPRDEKGEKPEAPTEPPAAGGDRPAAAASPVPDPALAAPAEAVTPHEAEARGRAGALPRRGWFSDLPDRGLFVLFLTAGTAAVLALKLMLPDAALAKWSAAGAACATLSGYAALAWRFRMPGDRLGDNCYYLGFLLTLASMAAALVQFDISAGDRGEVLERLIGSFGIALFSTFLGIALRVVFLQMRHELDDLEEATRHELQERAELLKGQLLHAVTELESFRLRTRQVLDERVMEVADLLAERMRAQAEEVLRLARDLADQGSRALGVHTEQAMRLEEAIRAQAAAAAALAERLGRVEVPPDLFREEIRKLADRLGASVAPLEKAAAAIAGRLDAVEVPADLVAARLAPFAEALARATEAVERLAQAEVSRRTALDEAAARATRAIEEASRCLAERPRCLFGRLTLGRRRREA
jgi:hypothetical protein